jgi:ABC-type antimicrobial peptide transport system permease subunit
LAPEPVVIGGTFSTGKTSTNGILAGFKSDEESVSLYKRHVSVLNGDIELLSKKSGTALIGESLAEMLELEPGMHVLFSYKSRFNDEVIKLNYEVAAVVDDPNGMSSHAAIINEKDFYDTYLNHLPENSEEPVSDKKISPDSPLMPALAHSWKRADRTYTNLDYNKKQKEIRHASFNGSIIDVGTIQELAKDVFQIETIINILSLVAMLIVFSITLVGVLNTVRMTIRDRTREIGTVRAIGMQKKLLVRTLLTEIGLLALFAALFGIIVSYVSMDVLSMPTFPSIDINIDLMLDNGHMKFLPAIRAAMISIFVIISLTILASWFPAKKAAKMPVAEALGHYE